MERKYENFLDGSKKLDGSNEKTELFKTFLHFLNAHKIESKDMDTLCKYFIKGNYTSVFADGISWSQTAQGYDYFYCLNLRWLTYLAKSHVIYGDAYELFDALKDLYECIDYSDLPHNDKITVEEFKRLKMYYKNLLMALAKKNDIDLGF